MEYQQNQDDSFHFSEAATLRTYFEKQVGTIESVLKKPHPKISEEDIHQLRVAIKRIKSLSKLILFCVPDFRSKKFMKGYNNIFTTAGKVRELQLEIAMLKKLDLFDSIMNYTHYLKKRLKKKKHLFFSIADTAQIRKLEKRYGMIFPGFNRVSKNEVNLFLEAESSEIRGLMETGNLKKKEVHRLRKILKEFYYTALIFMEKDDRFKFIDDFQELLGQWHNDVVLKGYLEKAVNSGHLGNKETKIIRVAKRKISSESKTFFGKIKQKIIDMNESQQISAIGYKL